jgi:hypothetical protein
VGTLLEERADSGAGMPDRAAAMLDRMAARRVALIGRRRRICGRDPNLIEAQAELSCRDGGQGCAHPLTDLNLAWAYCDSAG